MPKFLPNVQKVDPVFTSDEEHQDVPFVSHADLMDLIHAGIEAPAIGSLTYDPDGETAVDPLYNFGMDKLELAQHLGTQVQSSPNPSENQISNETTGADSE